MARYAKFFSVGGGGGGTNNLQLPVGTILDTTLRQVQDGLGTGSPLYLSTYRVGITSDASVTTQTSSVIQSSTTNANLVIAPNGNGALIAAIPDGTTVGGNSRGINSVDLQLRRSNAVQVASGNYSFIGSGIDNQITSTSSSIAGGQSNYIGGITSFIGSGNSNSIPFGQSIVIAGGASNTSSSNWCTISGGQSNTASTNTHATVVGGQFNVSSGQYSVAGGFTNTASSESSIALGRNNIASGSRRNTAIGEGNTASGFDGTMALGKNNSVSGSDAAIGLGNANSVSGASSIGIGISNNVIGNESLALGKQNTIGSAQSFSLGNNNNINVTPANSNIVTIGFNHKANAPFATSIGNRSWAYLYGQVAHANEWFSDIPEWGNAQESSLVARRSAALTTGATTVLSLDGTGVTNLIIPLATNRAWNVQVNWVAVVTTITGTATGITLGDIITGESLFGFKKIGGVSSVRSFIRDSQGADTAIMDTCSLAYSAGASQELAMTFTGPTFAGGGSVTMRVVAKVELVEVAY